MHEETGFEHAADERGPTTEELFERARMELGDEAFERERTAGRALSLPEAFSSTDRLLVELTSDA